MGVSPRQSKRNLYLVCVLRNLGGSEKTSGTGWSRMSNVVGGGGSVVVGSSAQ